MKWLAIVLNCDFHMIYVITVIKVQTVNRKRKKKHETENNYYSDQKTIKTPVIRKLFFIFLIVIIRVQSICAEQTDNDELIVFFEEPAVIPAKAITDIYPGIKSQLEQTIGWKLNFRPKVLLIRNNQTFQRMAGTDLIAAFADTQKNLIVIDYSKMNFYPFTLEITLKHELCHLLLHHHIRKTTLPRWLDEGIAQWVSHGISELIRDEKRSLLGRAVLSGNIISMNVLTYGFPKDKQGLSLAYEQSKSFTEYMIKKFGKNQVFKLLFYMKQGIDADSAIEKTFSVSLAELEKKWQNDLRKTTTWFTYISVHVYEILFFLAALITIAGFVKLLIKKRKYGEDEEDNEEDGEEENEECQ